MAFERRHELWTFDIFPKVMAAGKEKNIHIRPFGDRLFFTVGNEYTAVLTWLHGGSEDQYPATGYRRRIPVTATENGIDIKVTLPYEGEYRIKFTNEEDDNLTFAVYAVDGDLTDVYPFIGDLHMHTNYSDGDHDPANVVASYRAHGYDFLSITDHRRYYPSLYAIEQFKNIPTEMNLVMGEEVHLPPIKGFRVCPHTINFGGEYSINSLVEDEAVEEVGKDKKFRATREDCPEVMTRDEFEDKMTELAKGFEVPDNVDPLVASTLKWIYDEIRKANGLAIFVHPTWITGNTFHDSDALNDWLVENKIFDAFEVLGGENYFEQNGYQTVRYYEDKARGYRYPVVGSTDSHNCTPENRNAYICSTIVFSPENERRAIIDSIKNFRSVAVDTISKEFRLVGEMRYVRYGCFLLKNYFPIHDDACFEEGRLMKQAIYGTEDEKQDAVNTLTVMNGRMKKKSTSHSDLKNKKQQSPETTTAFGDLLHFILLVQLIEHILDHLLDLRDNIVNGDLFVDALRAGHDLAAALGKVSRADNNSDRAAEQVCV